MRHLGCLGCLVRFILLTSLISAEEIKNKCKNEVSWASCPSYLLAGLISAEEIKNNVKITLFFGLISKPYISSENFAYKPIFYWSSKMRRTRRPRRLIFIIIFNFLCWYQACKQNETDKTPRTPHFYINFLFPLLILCL